MKKITLLLVLLSFGKLYAQQPDNYNNNQQRNYTRRMPANVVRSEPINDDYSQVRIVDSTQEIRADVLPYKSDPKIRNDRHYFWCLNNVIHSTQGGYNGKLLNGHYIAFYTDKNLKEEGDFNRGLKDGVWKTWNPNGDLTNVVTWSDGIIVPDNQQPVWKKIPFFNKKDNQQPAAAPANSN